MLIKLKTRFPELVLGVLLTVAIFAMGMMFESSSNFGQTTQPKSTQKAESVGSNHGPQEASWHDPIVILTLGLVLVGIFQAGLFWVQLVLIRKTLGPAKEAADAAKLNAQAVMAAEGAHVYPILKSDNLRTQVFRGIIFYENSGNDSDNVPAPTVTLCFKNYGKTPAVLESVMHGIDFFETPSRLRTLHAEDRNLLEILGAGGETADLTVEMLGTFNRGMAKSVREYRGELLFFGEAVFKDFFNRRFRCVWECDGRTDGFRLVRYEEHQNPDVKS